ncbi:MAG: hypothetical protein A2848_01340 [Candidatus Magasanikbacteria bacterium RIFCSPHIGHO2_01_FULL_50_8]|uniref:SET domain-containing protein n=2 Tax=Candidatus Magasanikiibacteriota TaxID=1752731 RepID=A0A1F6LRT4_9BACT|nr:MAG: hypothetical protein A2848_01340 [Candidatus Magasanikbacteria bacterium RIFCSPHIGHO2_01_FULL_50_8]OGH67828.1 MAG: hypothetical protein A3C15_02090 [Candidatus Magasanikbacteria bacterium RIFCSPHIGHO2_02_FULL_50_9b]
MARPHRPPQFKLRTRKSAAGIGLYAEEAIPKNRFVIEYWGKLVSDARAEKILGKYLFDLENGKHIAGGTRKNIARYINHSCRPNCESRTVGNRVYIFSIKKIKAGDELTYDYGEEYFDGFIKEVGCRCVKCA